MEEEVAVSFGVRVRGVCEGECRSLLDRPGPARGFVMPLALRGTIAPFADIDNERQVPLELVVGLEVAAVPPFVLPQGIGPRPIHAVDKVPVALRVYRLHDAFEVSLEYLEGREWLPSRVHLDVEVLAKVGIDDREEEEPDRTIAVMSRPLREPIPDRTEVRAGVLQAGVDG